MSRGPVVAYIWTRVMMGNEFSSIMPFACRIYTPIKLIYFAFQSSLSSTRCKNDNKWMQKLQQIRT